MARLRNLIEGEKAVKWENNLDIKVNLVSLGPGQKAHWQAKQILWEENEIATDNRETIGT